MGGMSSFIKKAFGAIVGVLLLFLGIERRKNQKQKETIAKQKQQIIHEQKQAKVYKAETEAIKQSVILEEPLVEQKKVEAEIEKAKELEEVLAIANDIVFGFNSVPNNTSTTKN